MHRVLLKMFASSVGYCIILNELLEIERGLTAAGIQVATPHPDLKEVGKGNVLRVRLTAEGAIQNVEAVAPELRARLWTLRDGQHNSFPYVKVDHPLLSVPITHSWATDHSKLWKALNGSEARRAELRRLMQEYPIAKSWIQDWPGTALMRRCKERVEQLSSLDRGDAAAVPATFQRFLVAANTPEYLLTELTNRILSYAELRDESWIEAAHKALVEGLAVYFDVPEEEFDRDAGDPAHKAEISSALAKGAVGGQLQECALTGAEMAMHEGNFPQPNLPSLGQTYIFSKNTEIKAAHRYRRAAADAFPVARDIVMRLSGGVEWLTEDERKSKNWGLIPSEKPKESDLLLAFLPADTDLAAVAILTESEDIEAAYAALTKRVVKELDGTIERGFAQEQVQICIIRKVDPANRKVIFHRKPIAGAVHKAATGWRNGCGNVPPVLCCPVPDGKNVREAKPPHVAPLSLSSTTRTLYADGGTRRVDVIGRSAAEACALFLEEGDFPRRARDLLRLFLTRHSALLSGCSHAQRKSRDHLRTFDPKTELRLAALRSITWIALLLHKLDRPKEAYMSEPAFKLGQLLAVADVVHAGYCADVRGGDVPPTLLGNSVLSMAQSNPIKALAVLCGRWKPYGAWVKRSSVLRTSADRLVASKERNEQDRGWAIRRAQSQVVRASEISAELSGILPAKPDDVFRAELLLGYIAGLPPTEKMTASPPALSGDQSK